jgi:hypothetical protein
VAGAPFFFGDGDGDGLSFGVSPDSGAALGLAEDEGDSPTDGDGVGELLRFFFLLDAVGEDSGVGLGDNLFFFAEAEGLGDGVSDGLGLAVAFFFGDGDFSGIVLGFGVGDFSGVDFFFGCLRGVGVGVGAKIFLSLVPNVSSAGARMATPVSIAQTTNTIRSSRILESERSTSADYPGPQMEPARPRIGGNTRRGHSTA